ncbi:MAG: di-heme enzyme [Bryobacterales bacterium]|nr:di-heme enzyme [Bryobacterales bacterium]
MLLFGLPVGFPEPPVPVDNPFTPAKVELGRHLFYDKRLSVNGTQSCATCHEQAHAFADRRAHGVGATGEIHPRGSMSLANVAYSLRLTWANPHPQTLEEQALVPMTGRHPVEMGLSDDAAAFLQIAAGDPVYQKLFREAFGKDAFTLGNVTRAIASFERTLISGNSPYDRYHYGGDRSAVPEAAKRGEELFFNNRLQCFHCHGGFNFGGTSEEFQDNGLDAGLFKAPTLRNIGLTAPYMHDGRFATLEAVIEHYARGGMHGPQQSRFVNGFAITQEQERDLVEFLKTLTDQEFVNDPRFTDPGK